MIDVGRDEFQDGVKRSRDGRNYRVRPRVHGEGQHVWICFSGSSSSSALWRRVVDTCQSACRSLDLSCVACRSCWSATPRSQFIPCRDRYCDCGGGCEHAGDPCVSRDDRSALRVIRADCNVDRLRTPGSPAGCRGHHCAASRSLLALASGQRIQLPGLLFDRSSSRLFCHLGGDSSMLDCTAVWQGNPCPRNRLRTIGGGCRASNSIVG